MCFVGVGEHGGGPTQEQIAWCYEHQSAVEGARLEFSTPPRFFEAVADRLEMLPLVVGELQRHAIGCYSVHRPVKTAVRRAEHLLVQAEIARRYDPAPEAGGRAQLDEAWRRTLFHHFHDTLGGTCLPSAYCQVADQLGLAGAIADETIHLGLRRRLAKLPDDSRQRMVLFNASDELFEGYVECEPWLDWKPWENNWRLLDESGSHVPCQLIDSEASYDRMTRVLFRVGIEAGQLKTLRIDRADRPPADIESGVSSTSARLSSRAGVTISLNDGTLCFGQEAAISMPQLELIDDRTDTWSHGTHCYPQGPAVAAQWQSTLPTDNGPLMASLIREGRIGRSELSAEWRVYADECFAELRLRIQWVERHRLLKLTWPCPAIVARRWDGIPSGQLQRPVDGRECPLRDRTLLELKTAARLGVVCPDVFAADATESSLRLTLLRAAVMAHHDPNRGDQPRRIYCDRGEHHMRFRFYAGPAVTAQLLDHQAMMMHRPPVYADLTRGM